MVGAAATCSWAVGGPGKETALRKDFLLAGLLWLVLTAIGEVVAVNWDFQPLAAAEEANIVDEAFRVLVYMGIPVCAFVFATLIYSFIRFRRNGEDFEDGPPIRGHKGVIGGWLAISTALTVLVIIYPGTIGWLDLRASADTPDDLVIQVEGSRWVWKMTYPDQQVVSFTDLVLPVDQKVLFEVTATDVLHSFWVPAFRIKIDAVPGRTTTIRVTPNRTGSEEVDSGFRLQCAELCGLGHYVMKVPVRVVEMDEFEAWVAENTTKRAPVR